MINASNILNRLKGCFKRAAGPLLAIAIMLMAACERRPLLDPALMVKVRVEIDTRDMKNITTGIYNPNVPIPDIEQEVMHLMFYDATEDNLVTEVYISEREKAPNGNNVICGNVMIGNGTYRMLGYNFGTVSTVVYDYESWSGITAKASQVSKRIASAYRSKVDGEEVITYEPDHLLVTRNAQTFIPYHEDIWTIDAVARPVLDTYYLQIEVEGLEYVASAQAYLTSMAGGNRIAENEIVTDPLNTIYLDLVKSEDKGVPVICNIFNTFGHIDGENNELTVTFDVKTKNGVSQQFRYDITDLFKTQEAKENNWLLMKEKIIIFKPDDTTQGSGGMDPTVSDWENENHDILL